jgi:hypothetical protein
MLITKKENEVKILNEEKLFQLKIDKYISEGNELVLKENCIFKDGSIYMQCVMCFIWFLRNTRYFMASAKGSNFETCEPGHENLNNSTTTPCKQCRSILDKQKRAISTNFIHCLLRQYEKYGFTEEVFYLLLKKQQGKGLITGIKMNLTTNSDNCVGIFKYDSLLDATPENVYLEVQELAVQGLQIIDLISIWSDIYQCMIEQFLNPVNEKHVAFLKFAKTQYYATPSSIGIISGKDKAAYKKQLMEIHFTTIMKGAISHHVTSDIRMKRIVSRPNQATMETIEKNVIKQLKKQKWKCAYSGLPMTIVNGVKRFSFERLNNNLRHFTETGELDNIVFVCRLFNTRRQLSNVKMLIYFLSQTLLPVPYNVRSIVESKLLVDDKAIQNPKKQKI